MVKPKRVPSCPSKILQDIPHSQNQEIVKPRKVRSKKKKKKNTEEASNTPLSKILEHVRHSQDQGQTQSIGIIDSLVDPALPKHSGSPKEASDIEMVRPRRVRRKKSKKNSQPSIDKASCARFWKILFKFRCSKDQVYTFDASLTDCERHIVHHFCEKLGMTSKSFGKGEERRLTVYNIRKKVDFLDEKPVITFSEESKRVLMDLFIHYPPGVDDIGKQNLIEPSVKTPKSRFKSDDIFRKPGMNKAEISKRVESLTSRKHSGNLKKIFKERSELPIASYKDVITSTVAAHQVVLICGETGCGKTTQVPQYILDDMWAKGEDCKIICSQPRRISAMSVAERISCERGESIGESVGYKIRLKSAGGRHSSILFCTNGVILRVLIARGSNAYESKETELSQITHFIVDEIHERDRFSDFMLAILRDLLPSNPHLRLVLMSATMETERFSEYFGGCPIIRVPGSTHPVKTFYLDEVLSILKNPNKNHLNSISSSNQNEDSCLNEESRMELDEAIEKASSNEEFDRLLGLIYSQGSHKFLNYQHSLTGMTPLMVCASKGRVSDISTLLSLGADCHLQAHDGTTALDYAKRENKLEVEEIIKKHMEDNSSILLDENKMIEKHISTTNPEIIDVDLIVQLIMKICKESENGAILVFLPGWQDINKTRESLSTNPFFTDSYKYRILPLHSKVPTIEQKLVFERPPKGCRKIILATNIAETAVTIDDVVYVIDSGRMKEKNYDPFNNFSTLESSWISQANEKQREGRAGRCQPGFCYHLYSRLRAASLSPFQVPEIKRMPIDELCLQVKMLDPNCKIEDFLKKTLDTPVSQAIKNGVTTLQEIGALSNGEQLTTLGKKMGLLPVHPRISKMLFSAILLNCLDPALTLACVSSYMDPFKFPLVSKEKKNIYDAKSNLASLYGGFSDQLAIIAAFDGWNSVKGKDKEIFCHKYFLSSVIMHTLYDMRKQLKNELVKAGCILDDVSRYSVNSKEPGILRALLVSGFYPSVGKLHPHTSRKGGQVHFSSERGRFMVQIANGNKAMIHSDSLNSKIRIENPNDPPLLVYDEVIRGDVGSFMRHCSIIGPIPLLLFANEIVVAKGLSKDKGDDNVDDSKSSMDVDKMEGLNETDKKGNKEVDKMEGLNEIDKEGNGDLEEMKGLNETDKQGNEDVNEMEGLNETDKEGNEDIDKMEGLNEPDKKGNEDVDEIKGLNETDKEGNEDVEKMKGLNETDKKGNEDVDKMEGLNETDKQEDEILSSPEKSVTVIVDRWLSFKCTALEVAQIHCLRERLSEAIHFMVTNSRKVLPPALEGSIYTIACILAYDGMKGIPIPKGNPKVKGNASSKNGSQNAEMKTKLEEVNITGGGNRVNILGGDEKLNSTSGDNGVRNSVEQGTQVTKKKRKRKKRNSTGGDNGVQISGGDLNLNVTGGDNGVHEQGTQVKRKKRKQRKLNSTGGDNGVHNLGCDEKLNIMGGDNGVQILGQDEKLNSTDRNDVHISCGDEKLNSKDGDDRVHISGEDKNLLLTDQDKRVHISCGDENINSMDGDNGVLNSGEQGTQVTRKKQRRRSRTRRANKVAEEMEQK